MRKTLSILLAITLMLTISLSFAEAKHVRPLAFTPENCDLNNGVFWFDIQAADRNAAGSFTMKHLNRENVRIFISPESKQAPYFAFNSHVL